jgi:hypothetical protein
MCRQITSGISAPIAPFTRQEMYKAPIYFTIMKKNLKKKKRKEKASKIYATAHFLL